MASIKQNPASPPLPDFRNFGVMLRILLGVNLLALMAALVMAGEVAEWVPRFVELAAWVQPLLLFNLALLASVSPLLRRLPAVGGRVLVLFLAALSAALFVDFWQFMGMDEGGWQRVLRAALLAAFAAATLLYYFHLCAKAFSPAVTEARLQALTARIRPHFLFNSLNAVLSLIRSEPRRAETALEELAELFRALMRDHRDLMPLADEIALCRQYLDLEKLRLGEGEKFSGEGILAITKALLQSGVAYVGGYQGSPISHLMDVLADAQDILTEHGIRFENSASEATAAATLAVGPLARCSRRGRPARRHDPAS